MSRELARQSSNTKISTGALDYSITQKDGTVWVTLSGILDQPGLECLIDSVSSLLESRGFRVVLDGVQLMHIDYRAIRPLIRWNRDLRAFHHQLFLADWSNYLKAILSMEDWNCELNPGNRYPAAWRVLTGTSPGLQP